MALTLKKKNILQLWIGNPRKWIRSADLRKTLVLGFNKDYIYNEQSHKWKNIVTGAEYDKKPLPYTDASKFYGDLKSLIKDGILENQKIKQDKGKPKSMYRPTKKHMLRPLKNHYVSFIENKDIKHIHHGLDYMLLLPENLTVNEFLGKKQDLVDDKKHINVERAVLLEGAFDRFFCFVRKILFEARLEKAKKLWGKKIEYNVDIYPPLKLYLGIELLKNQLINFSPKFYVQYSYGKQLILSKKLQDNLDSLVKMLFADIYKVLGYRSKDINEINDKIRSGFEKHFEYLNNVWNEIHEIIEEKEFSFVISPSGFLKPSPDFSKGIHWLLEKQEEQKLVKGKKNGKTKVYQKTTVNIPTMKNTISLYLNEIEKTTVEYGEYWFNMFSENTQRKLKELCDDLGYSELGMYQNLGLFMFPFPTLRTPDTTFDIDKNETGIDRNVTELDKKYLEPL